MAVPGRVCVFVPGVRRLHAVLGLDDVRMRSVGTGQIVLDVADDHRPVSRGSRVWVCAVFPGDEFSGPAISQTMDARPGTGPTGNRGGPDRQSASVCVVGRRAEGSRPLGPGGIRLFARSPKILRICRRCGGVRKWLNIPVNLPKWNAARARSSTKIRNTNLATSRWPMGKRSPPADSRKRRRNIWNNISNGGVTLRRCITWQCCAGTPANPTPPVNICERSCRI